jgi:hypothetical protein
MASYNKSFNFRNGVQVDDDNFIVNANGLVGIGTSIPTEFLDVHGTAKITGLVTATNLAITGVSTFYSDVKIGSGITFNASTGAARATTFFGSAAGLTGIYAIAVDGWYINAGTISTTSKVGIGTDFPNYSLQVGLDPLTGNGLSVDAITGNVNTTGIITATRFSGPGDGVTDLNASVITSGTLNNARLPQDISVSGIVTAYSFTGFGTNLQGLNATNITNGTLNNSRLPQNISITGIITANLGIITSLASINLNNTNLNNTNLNNTGIATLGVANASILLVSGVTTSTGGFVGNVTGTATTATSISGSPNITVSNITSSNINNTGIITSSNIISGISSIGISTVSTRLYAESIGVGTDSPSGDIHIRRSSSSILQVTSDTGEAIVAVGRSTTLTGSNGALKFGNTSGIYPYSLGGNTLDIINYSTGNLNYYLNYSTGSGNIGDFNWIYGPDATDPLMTLTYGGKLGIGVTDPTNTLHVVGTSTITGNAFFGQNLDVVGNTNISGTLNLTEDLNSNITGNVTGNINSTVGFSTFYNISVTNDASSFRSFIGIGTIGSNPNIHFQVLDKFIVSASGIGIGTDVEIPIIDSNFTISASNTDAVFNRVGIGTTVPQAALTVDGGTIISGVTTSLSGFTSQLFGNPVQITVSGSILTFTVPGVGTTSLTLF